MGYALLQAGVLKLNCLIPLQIKHLIVFLSR